MNDTVSGYLSSAVSAHKRSHFFFYLICFLSVVITVTVFWQFRIKGISKTQDVICGKTEHTHTEECYSEVLICEQEHTHTEECYQKELICTLTEHNHTVHCMCDSTADVETEADYICKLPVLTGDSRYDLCNLAISQLGYTESTANFTLLSDKTTTKGYTRYGDWYGSPYADWSGIFVSFCLYYSGIEENDFPYLNGAWARALKLKDMNLFKSPGQYIPESGDIIFLDNDQNDEPEETAIILSVDASQADSVIFQLIQGDYRDCVSVYYLSYPNEAIYGYGILPQKTEEPILPSEISAEPQEDLIIDEQIIDNNEDETEAEPETAKNTAQDTVTAVPKISIISEKGLTLTGASNLTEGTYGSTTLRYNRTKNAFVTDDAYAIYRNNGSLGIAGDFHIVGFQTVTLSSHCNGNILTRELTANSNFGTNGLANELSYIGSYAKVNGTSASNTSHILALGSGATLGLTDNNTAISVNGTKIDKPRNIVKDIDSTVPLVDFDYVEAQLRSLSTALATQGNTGVTASLNDQNNRRLTLNSADGLSFYNFTASDLSNYANNPLRIYGFSSGHTGTLVINVNCNNSNVTIPEALMYIGNQEQQTSEVSTFTNGYILWNFYNCDGKTITAKRMSGSVLAPGADVTSTSNLNGSIYAQNILLQGESHRNDFIGDLGDFSLNRVVTAPELTAQLQINGIAATNEGFQVTFSAVSGGNLTPLDTVTQQSGTVTYTPDYPGGTTWYCIQQVSGTVSGDYYYDTTPCFVKAEKSGTTTEITYYTPLDKTLTPQQIITGNSVNTSLLTTLSEEAVPVFNNLNTPFVLPSTGGKGLTPLYSAGAVFILIALLGFAVAHKKGGMRIK